MVDLVLWGASGHGKVVIDVARAMNKFKSSCFIDDASEKSGCAFCECQVFGAAEYLRKKRGQGSTQFLVSIGNNELRAACFQHALDHGLMPATLVHPSAVIAASALLQDGTIVMARVVVNAGAQVGRNCILNTAAVVEHDCQIGDHVHLSPGVLLGGGVTVHSFAHVGIGAIILPGAEIGERATVGAGAVVLDYVPPGVTVVGVPARQCAHRSSSI